MYTEWRIVAWTCEIAKGCSPSRSRFCLDTCSKNKATNKYFSVYTNFKKLCLGKIRLKRKEGVLYTVWGLDIGFGWCVEMCDINNDFDRHCLLSKKRLIQGNIKIILYKFANQWYIWSLYKIIRRYHNEL